MTTTAINNGLVIDPKNRIYSNLNLLISGGKICGISKEPFDGDLVINADGLIVCPGFVDMHMHEDPFDPVNNRFEISIFDSMARMGVTTAIGGNCGIGPEDVIQYMQAVEELGLPVNFGMFLPHEILRKEVGICNRYEKVPYNKLLKMQAKAAKLIASGCLGISFGIRYIPGITKEELLMVSKAIGTNKKILTAHIRDDAAKVIEAAEEFIEIGYELNLPVHLSHIGSMAAYGQMAEFLSVLDAHKSNGLDISADCYPYNAFSTRIGETTYDQGFLERYKTSYDSIEIADGPLAGVRCTEELFKKLRTENPEVITIGHMMRQEEVDLALSHMNVFIASDGLLNKNQGHPRASGTFPKVISEYVKRRGCISLNEAISKMTYLPAERLNIDKGTLSLNSDADIVIFNYELIQDKATFENPTAPPEGIRYVLVNGEIVVKDNIILNRNVGRLIKN